MRVLLWFFLLCIGSLPGFAQQHVKPAGSRPNIIYILADDLGYGDISAFNSHSKIATPHIDGLASAGMMFTDAHSNSAVCSPTRYGVLTGRYAWRTRLQNGVLWSYDPPLISPGRTTVASLLKRNGYYTGCIGKWHLGLGWQKHTDGTVDFSKPIEGGPIHHGFDYFYGITASLDIPPYFYIENGKITTRTIDSIAATTGKGFWRAGPVGNDFKHAEVLPRLTEVAGNFIKTHANKADPFFLYIPLPSPHTPILPTAGYLNTSGINAYADFVMMTDAMVGNIIHAVKEAGIEDNTMIIFTSDNGVSPSAGLDELEAAGHHSSFHFRGYKADIYEGGHRVPFIVKWPGTVTAGTKSNAGICLTDFLATAAELVNTQLHDHEGEDSYSLMPLLKQKGQFKRAYMVLHSIDGNFAIRAGKWKLVFAYGSGGWSAPVEKEAKAKGRPALQLFDLENDIAETHNLVQQHPKVVKRLTLQLQSIINEGRSTAGKKQENDVAVQYLKYQ